ncbi:MAG: DUF4139 domain-containing protein [Proteobacteria bacterium]|nr:DUF4139 domain-containing protein [Pseudomonadota bacterium]
MHNRSSRLLSVSVVLLAGFVQAASAADEKTVVAKDRTQLNLTIYNGNLALIQDQRRLNLDKGLNRVGFAGVSRAMMPSTAFLAVTSARPVKILEQDFAFDLLTPSKILEYAVGQKVHIVQTHPTTGEEKTVEGVLLSTQGGTVIKVGDRIETNPPGRLVFTKLPAGLRREPTLLATLDLEKSAQSVLDLRYLTGGLSWQADYVADYSEKDGTIALQAWATVTNKTGIDFKDATLRFVAGSVNRRTHAPSPQRMRAMAKASMEVAATAPGGGMRAQSVGDFYLYQLPRKASLVNQQTKQLALLKAKKVTVTREYQMRGGGFHYRRYSQVQPLNAEIILKFVNKKFDGLGLPLPAGIVRVYGKSPDKSALFLGEDTIQHTAKGREVELSLGRAFDISAKRRQTSFRKQGLAKNTFEAGYEIAVKNAKDKPATIKLFENMPGEWTILSESHNHKKKNSQEAVWSLKVPAGGETVLTYEVRSHR